MKMKLILVLVVIFVTGLFVFFWFNRSQKDFEIGKVERRDISEIVTESGSISTTGKVAIYSPTNGIVDKIYVTNGETVKEKQKLFSVKSTATPQEKTAAYAAYQAAKSAVQQAENNRRSTSTTVTRVHDDLKDKDSTETFTEKETRTMAEVANDNAWDALVAAQAQLASAQANYFVTQNSMVVAPMSGEVFNLSIATGTAVLANSPLSPTSPIMMIGKLGGTEITVPLGESDILKISVGQKAEVKFDAIDNKVYKGDVVRFDEVGNIAQGVAKYKVYINIVDADDALKPGMNADVDIMTQQQEKALAVPNTAIKPFQKGRAVRILNQKGELVYQPVKLGIKGKEFTQILEGLSVGQEIVLSNAGEKVSSSGFLKF